jgi:hypothetical protein
MRWGEQNVKSGGGTEGVGDVGGAGALEFC